MLARVDTIASPDFVRFVYDGDNSDGEDSAGPAGSREPARAAVIDVMPTTQPARCDPVRAAVTRSFWDRDAP